MGAFSTRRRYRVRGSGRTLAEAFEQAALAMTAVIVEPDTVAESETITLRVSAPDVELLLTEWLNALIHEMATRRMLFTRLQVELRGLELQGRAWGDSIDIARHQPAAEIKGATSTELHVGQSEDGVRHAQSVVDV